jgi:glutaredoxin
MSSEEPAGVKFEKVQEHLPELKHVKFIVVVVGYPYCPYSAKALQAAEGVEEWSQSKKFVPLERPAAAKLKNHLDYHGSMPLVFVRDKAGKMRHIGGGDEMEEFADLYQQKKHHSRSGGR